VRILAISRGERSSIIRSSDMAISQPERGFLYVSFFFGL
jgi:hypothetical protein